MKKLLVFLFSLFFLSSSSVFADDISDFQIEGISIGDSLLDYMTEDEILKEIEINKDRFLHLKEPYKYSQISLGGNYLTYDSISVLIKNNSTNQYITDKNEKYTILYVRGSIDYLEDFDSCLVKRDEIDKILSTKFPEAQRIENIFTPPTEPSGQSIVNSIYFEFESGAIISSLCADYEETFRVKKNWREGLNISIIPRKTNSWLVDFLR